MSAHIASRDLTERSAAAIAAALSAASVVVLPVGSIEQHGPHLPVATDLITAETIARASVVQAATQGVDAWYLPSLAYTKSDEHHWMPGTIWIGWEELMNTLVGIGQSLASTPCRRLVFYNGHGGNSALLQVACRELRRRFGLQTFLAHTQQPPDLRDIALEREFGLGIHGGFLETSLISHLRPDLVDLGLACRSVPEHLDTYHHVGFGKPIAFGWISDDFGTGGVLGDPTTADPDVGKRIYEHAVQTAAEGLAEIACFDPSAPAPDR